MNKKELSELRRRFKPDYDNISQVYGCYVNAAKEIVAEVDLPVGRMEPEEAEMYLKLLKKTLSGTFGRNLFDIEFTVDQVESSEEHRLLMALRDSRLEDEGLRRAFYQHVIESVDLGDESYAILLAADSYDVPCRGSEGEIFSEGSSDVFDYFVCCLCPVKDGKAELTYHPEEQSFREASTGRILTAPDLGFLFPCFDDRAANIYDLLYYSRKVDNIHEEFIENMFGTAQAPMSAGDQQASFSGALMNSLGEDCSLEVVSAVHENLRERLEAHKESRDPEPPEIYVEDMDEILSSHGVAPGKVEAFHTAVEEAFGGQPALDPANLVETRRVEVATEGVKIRIDPDYLSSIQTRVIDGQPYLLIPALDTVEVNGIAVTVSDSIE